MECPRCKATMVKEGLEGEKVDACKSCGGFWVKKNQLNHLLKESGGDVEEISIDDNPHSDDHPLLTCRVCSGVTMKKVNFLEYSDIIMDYCPSCGAFWLDKGELEKMHQYIKKIQDGSHEVKNFSAYNLLRKLSEISYSIFK